MYRDVSLLQNATQVSKSVPVKQIATWAASVENCARARILDQAIKSFQRLRSVRMLARCVTLVALRSTRDRPTQHKLPCKLIWPSLQCSEHIKSNSSKGHGNSPSPTDSCTNILTLHVCSRFVCAAPLVCWCSWAWLRRFLWTRNRTALKDECARPKSSNGHGNSLSPTDS